ncbi:MAG: STAS domain-containing protein [Anaerolineae bacterium]|jgi:anti-anti-sigma factor
MTDSHQTLPPAASIAPSGRLDASAVPTLERKLFDALQAGVAHLTIDLSQVSYVSSSVLRCFLLAQRQADRQRTHLELVEVQPRLMDTFELCGFDRVLHCSPSSVSSS